MTSHAFWIEAFLSATPQLLANSRWTQGDRQLNSIEDRARLAAEFADYALEQAISRGYVTENAQPTAPKCAKRNCRRQSVGLSGDLGIYEQRND